MGIYGGKTITVRISKHNYDRLAKLTHRNNRKFISEQLDRLLNEMLDVFFPPNEDDTTKD